jgi:hypothetical protein
MTRNGRSRSAGLTLVEMVFVLAISGGLMVILGNILISSTNSADYVMSDSNRDFEVRRTLGWLLGELRAAGTATSIATTDPQYDAVTFQTPGPALDTLQWGAVDAGGVWHPGWSVRYLVDRGTLFRRALDAAGAPSGEDQVFVRGIDGLRDGRKGFALSRTGSVIAATIRVNRVHADGRQFQKEYGCSIGMKNP